MKLRKIKINKKAQLSSFSPIMWMITAFLAVVLFAGMIYTMGILNDVFTQVGLDNEKNSGQPGYVNISQATEDIWGQADESIQALKLVAITYILALGASIIIIGFLQRKHPFLFFIYMLIVLLGVIFAPTISNAYEELLGSGIFPSDTPGLDSGLEEFTAANHILLNLPIYVLIIGFSGAIGLFIQLVRGDNSGNINNEGNI